MDSNKRSSYPDDSLVASSVGKGLNSSTSLTTSSIILNKKCGLLLKEGVSIWNFFSIVLITYLMVLGFMMAANFFIDLIQDPKYYVLSQDELG